VLLSLAAKGLCAEDPVAEKNLSLKTETKMKKPNILWFISDDTSADALGYTGGRALTPNIDSIARDGVIFENFFCVSTVCTPSRYNYLTGQYGGRCPAVIEGSKKGEPYNLYFNTHLDPSREKTIGHLLQSAGYRTGFVGKWHVGGSKADAAAIQKIDDNADVRDPVVQAQLKTQQEQLCALVRKAGFDDARSVIWGNHESLPDAAKIHNLEWTTKGALDIIDQASRDGKPFFLSMATTTIHGPNHVSALMSDPRLTGGGYTDAHLGSQASRASIYERIAHTPGLEYNSTTAGALWMDDAMGAVLKKLKDLGIEEDTIVIFSTDHGPSDSHGGKASVYESGVHIPFCLKWQGKIKGGQHIKALAQNIDLLPTLLALAEVTQPADLTVDGKNLVPLLFENGPSKVRDDAYLEFGYARAVRTEQWKYIACRLPPSILDPIKSGNVNMLYTQYGKPIKPDVIKPTMFTPTLQRFPNYFVPDQLYDLEKDPREQTNLAADPKFADVMAGMRERLRAHLKTMESPFPLDNPDPFFTSARFETLKAGVQKRLTQEYPLWKADAEYMGFDRK
jgi:arylsulfatase A-like enzyme